MGNLMKSERERVRTTWWLEKPMNDTINDLADTLGVPKQSIFVLAMAEYALKLSNFEPDMLKRKVLIRRIEESFRRELIRAEAVA